VTGIENMSVIVIYKCIMYYFRSFEVRV